MFELRAPTQPLARLVLPAPHSSLFLGLCVLCTVSSSAALSRLPASCSPTVLSQYTNACVLYATLTGLSPIGLGDAGTNLEARGYDVALLQTNAWLAYTSYRDEQRSLCTGYGCVRFINPVDGTLDDVPATTTAPRTAPWMDSNVPDELVCPAPPVEREAVDCGDPELSGEPACSASPWCRFAAGVCLQQHCAAFPDAAGCSTAPGCIFSNLGSRCVDSGVPAGMATITDSDILSARGLVPGSEPPLPLLGQLTSACDGEWRRCYSGDQDGYGASQLHTRCNNKGPTLAIIRSGERIFGGYAPQSWTSARMLSLAARGGCEDIASALAPSLAHHAGTTPRLTRLRDCLRRTLSQGCSGSPRRAPSSLSTFFLVR